MQVLSPERSDLALTAAVSLVTLAALALAAAVLAHWTWVWFAPRAEPRAQPVAEQTAGIASAQNLFGTLERERNVAAPTGIAVRLLGVVAAPDAHDEVLRWGLWLAVGWALDWWP